ncbi:hypothetical protein Misp05_17840 [Micromonospora sp. NBRC 107095]|nr:hypothetical protein Misp05_17840 [Micromonospora sp. NBRC 107095]
MKRTVVRTAITSVALTAALVAVASPAQAAWVFVSSYPHTPVGLVTCSTQAAMSGVNNDTNYRCTDVGYAYHVQREI